MVIATVVMANPSGSWVAWLAGGWLAIVLIVGVAWLLSNTEIEVEHTKTGKSWRVWVGVLLIAGAASAMALPVPPAVIIPCSDWGCIIDSIFW